MAAVHSPVCVPDKLQQMEAVSPSESPRSRRPSSKHHLQQVAMNTARRKLSKGASMEQEKLCTSMSANARLPSSPIGPPGEKLDEFIDRINRTPTSQTLSQSAELEEPHSGQRLCQDSTASSSSIQSTPASKQYRRTPSPLKAEIVDPDEVDADPFRGPSIRKVNGSHVCDQADEFRPGPPQFNLEQGKHGAETARLHDDSFKAIQPPRSVSHQQRMNARPTQPFEREDHGNHNAQLESLYHQISRLKARNSALEAALNLVRQATQLQADPIVEQDLSSASKSEEYVLGRNDEQRPLSKEQSSGSSTADSAVDEALTRTSDGSSLGKFHVPGSLKHAKSNNLLLSARYTGSATIKPLPDAPSRALHDQRRTTEQETDVAAVNQQVTQDSGNVKFGPFEYTPSAIECLQAYFRDMKDLSDPEQSRPGYVHPATLKCLNGQSEEVEQTEQRPPEEKPVLMPPPPIPRAPRLTSPLIKSMSSLDKQRSPKKNTATHFTEDKPRFLTSAKSSGSLSSSLPRRTVTKSKSSERNFFFRDRSPEKTSRVRDGLKSLFA